MDSLDVVLEKMLAIDVAQTQRIEKLEKRVTELAESHNKLIHAHNKTVELLNMISNVGF